ncbi:MAG: lipocalin-like domain-containing protein [Pseudomonadota bacterium]|jgi:predicted secreted hydrolase
MKAHPGAIGSLLLLLAAVLTPPAAAGADESRAWQQAAGTRSWSFPEDHGSHPDFQTEWWYFTGNVATEDGVEMGYQLTFFRTGLAAEPAVPGNPWSVRDLYMAHFAVTDARSGGFSWTERTSRAGPGLAGAKEGDLDVWLLDWNVVHTDGVYRLSAESEGMELDLTLTPRKAPVLHGRNGLSLKGADRGQSSWYASITDLGTGGTIRVPGRGKVNVHGRSWFDHEFGSNQLAADQEGWDWFGLHLSDGTELMIYMLRRTDGTLEPASSGTFVTTDGSWQHLALEDIRIRTDSRWKSPRSGGSYPAGWTIRVPSRDLEISVSPLVSDQELTTEGTAGITYWEGAVTVRGRAGANDITGAGYVELTGYAGSLGGIF